MSEESPLTTALRDALADPSARSFQLAGDDLLAVPLDALIHAARALEAQLERVPAELRDRVLAEHAAHHAETRAWLGRYNRSLRRRVQGYLELARRLEFQYPWPIVAILGICQVRATVTQSNLYGLIGAALSRLGRPAVEGYADWMMDALRRTNRGIFADSVPLVLYALRVFERRRDGEDALADALVQGPLPLTMDAQSRDLIAALDRGLQIEHGATRFTTLAALTLTHFEREQAIFSHHLRARSPTRARPAATRKGLLKWLAASGVDAPVIRRRQGLATLEFQRVALPAGYDMRAHGPRVELFGELFVTSITGSIADYACAARYVVDTFGRPGEPAAVQFPDPGESTRVAGADVDA